MFEYSSFHSARIKRMKLYIDLYWTSRVHEVIKIENRVTLVSQSSAVEVPDEGPETKNKNEPTSVDGQLKDIAVCQSDLFNSYSSLHSFSPSENTGGPHKSQNSIEIDSY